MSGLAFFKHKCFCNGWSEDHRKSDVTGNGIETEKSKRRRWWDYRKYPYFLFMCLVFQGKLRNWHIKSAAPSGDWQSNTVRLSTVESPHPKPISFCILDFSGVFKGGRWCDRPPPLVRRNFFLANFALFCRLHFATEPYEIRVQRHGRLYIIACYYTDVHARPEASSDMSVFTIEAFSGRTR